MNGPIAQIISICSYGNAALADPSPEPFTLQHSTARFCSAIEFIDLDPPDGRKPVASDAMVAADHGAWVEFLRTAGVRRLYLHHVPTERPRIEDRLAAAFVGGGGRWLIEANKDAASDYWEARWNVRDKDAVDRRIWCVRYARMRRDYYRKTSEDIGIGGLKPALGAALEDCAAFARAKALDGFALRFEQALSCLSAGAKAADLAVHPDLVPCARYSDEAIELLAASQSAWVFGGMGSWNDLGFDGEDQKTYERISDALYGLLCRVFSSATNEFKTS